MRNEFDVFDPVSSKLVQHQTKIKEKRILKRDDAKAKKKKKTKREKLAK